MKNTLLVLTLLLGVSCTPMVGLQSGRSLGKDSVILTPYIQTGNIDVVKGPLPVPSPSLPGAGVQLACGVTKCLDVGGKIDLSTFGTLQVKYQILGNHTSTFAVSLGAESGIALAPFLIVGAKFYYYMIPAFISYHPTERLCFYARPFYSFGQIAREGKRYGKDSVLENDITTKECFAFSYGFSFGRKNRFSLEIGHYDAQVYRPTQIALGYTFGGLFK